MIAQTFDWDFATAEKEYVRAIELDPNYATAHHWRAECLALEGRFDEALPEIDRARQLDPLSLIIATDRGAFLYFARRYDSAIQQLNTVLEMEPNFPRAHIVAYAYAQKGEYDSALLDLQRWRGLDSSPWIPAMKAYVYGRSGQSAQGREALNELEELCRNHEKQFQSARLSLGDKIQRLDYSHRRVVPAITICDDFRSLIACKLATKNRFPDRMWSHFSTLPGLPSRIRKENYGCFKELEV